MQHCATFLAFYLASLTGVSIGWAGAPLEGFVTITGGEFRPGRGADQGVSC